MARDLGNLALAALLLLQHPASAAAVESTTGPVYGGALAWTAPDLTITPERVRGFLAVTAFNGRYVALERDATASTSMDGITWVGRGLPGDVAIDARTELEAAIAAGPQRVVIVRRGAAWSSTDGEAWAAAATPPAGPSRVTAATAAGDGFIALGVTETGRAATAWRSADGASWQPVAAQSAFDHFCPTAVTASGPNTIVAVGDDCYPYLARPAVAVSTDGGLTWRRAPAQATFSEEGRLHAVIRRGTGFIAVGEVVRDVYPGTPYVAMYVSSDGLTWRRVGYFSPPGGAITRLFVLPIPDGYLALAAGRGRATAFVSVDGSRWTRSTSMPAAPHVDNDDFSERINGVAALGTSIAVVGTSDMVLSVDVPVPNALALVGHLTTAPSRLGSIPIPPPVPVPEPTPTVRQPAFPGSVTWRVGALPPSDGEDPSVGSSAAFDVAPWRSGFAAVGQVTAVDGAIAPALWLSPDGVRWSRYDLPPGCGGRLAATSTTLVLAGAAICRSVNGTDWTRATDLPHALVGSVDVVAQGSSFVLAMNHASPTRRAIRVWRSGDGLHWTTAGGPSVFTSREATALAASTRRVAMLTQRFVVDRNVTTPMVSSDGRRWTLGTAQPAFAPSADPVLMIAGGPGFLAAGSYQPRSRMGAAIWTSADGVTWRRVYVVLPSSGYVEVGGLSRIGPGYAAFGLVAPASQEDPARPTVWLSPDGTRWRNARPLPMPAGGGLAWVEVAGAAGAGRTAVVVGTQVSAAGRHAVVWTGTYRAP